MEFTPITEADFPARRRRPRGSNEFRDAIEALEMGHGFSVPCIWKHFKYSSSFSCGGATSAHQVIRKLGRHIQTTCINGTLHILRVDVSRARIGRRNDGE